MGILGGYLPGSAPLHGEEQRPSGAGGRHWGGDGSEQHGQGSSTQQGRRLVESFQRRAQPVGGDGDDRTGPAPAPRPGRSCSLIWPSRLSSPSSRPGYATTAHFMVSSCSLGCLAACGGPGPASRSMRIASTPMMSSTGAKLGAMLAVAGLAASASDATGSPAGQFAFSSCRHPDGAGRPLSACL